MSDSTLPKLDDLDRILIEMLSTNAQQSNRKIATELDISEGTVRGRIKKLQQARLISFTAVTSPDLEGANKLAFIGILAELKMVKDIARNVAALPTISGVLITMGRFNILGFSLFDTLENLHQTASETILSIPGVRHVETSIAVKTIKYNSRIVHITDDN